jgi:hypothetical protein
MGAKVHDVGDFPGVQRLNVDTTARKPKHAAYAAQILKLRRTQEFQLPRCLQQLANEAGGHPGPTSPSGQAGDHRRQARGGVILAGRAPDGP